MKKHFIIALASAGLILAACGNGGKQQAGANEVSEGNEAVEETVDATLPEAGRGDLGGFDLRGPVKECVWGEMTVTFNEAGQLLSQNGETPEQIFPGGVTRDNNGRLQDCNADAFGSCYYSYDDKGLPTKIASDDYCREFTYDANGYVATERITIYPEMGDEEGHDEVLDYTYTIVDKDNMGNWTCRKDQNGREDTRTITYFE